MLAVFAFACFLSMPVLSSEGPWDSDNNNSSTDGSNDPGNSDTDSTTVNGDMLLSAGSDGIFPDDLMVGIVFTNFYPYIIGVVFSQGSSQSAVMAAGSSSQGGNARVNNSLRK